MDPTLNNKETSRASALGKSIVAGVVSLANNPAFVGHQASDAWLFRDDIGAPGGVKGYEEQVNSVGMHHGHCHWPSEITWNTYNSLTLRRGFKVW